MKWLKPYFAEYGCVIFKQAWVRWLSTIANGMRQDKDKALAFLRNIALSETVDEYHANLRALKISNIWTKASSENLVAVR